MANGTVSLILANLSGVGPSIVGEVTLEGVEYDVIWEPEQSQLRFERRAQDTTTSEQATMIAREAFDKATGGS